MASSVDGLISGLGTSDLISQLMAIERLPQKRLQTQKETVERVVAAYRSVNTKISATGTAATALTGVKSWELAKASTSDATRVAVSASAGASAGTISFVVNQLAKASASVTSGSVASATTAVVDGPILLAKGAAALGITALDQGATLALGAHSIEVKDDAGTLKIFLDGHTVGEPVTAGSAFTVTNAAGDSITGTMGTTITAGKATAHNIGLAAHATLQQTAEAIGKAGAGVSAAAVQVSAGSYKLQLASTTTGTASDLSLDADAFLTGTLGSLQTLTAGADAKITVGEGTGAYVVTRPTNTIGDLLPGVTMTLQKLDPAAVTISVSRDADGLAAKVAAMVDSANTAIQEMKGLTSYNAETKKAALLVGDGMMRRLQAELVTTFTSPVSGNALKSPSAVGVSVGRDGKLTFDKATFLEEYAKDPVAVEALLGKGTTNAAGEIVTRGVAGRVEEFNKRITNATDGLIPGSIKTREREVSGFTSRIASWDNRIELRERKLKNQFAGMETALGKMQQQSSWLAGQLASLPRMGG